jgi:hypothetical protein
MRHVVACFAVVAVVSVALFSPVVASAQQAGIAGTVKDSSGAVLPGVTVEASSPALIEKVRTVVSDSSGRYSFVNLAPGTYEVAFTLSGFKTIRRTDILLEGAFTAQVDADMQVGSLAETLTVTGESPIVDVVNNRTTFVVNRDMLDAIPTATRSLQARANLIPGTVVTPVGSGQTSMTIHGSSSADQVVMVDGMRLNLLEGSGQFSGIYLNDGMAREITYDTGAQNAEMAQGGLRVNMIPREGGNRFSGAMFGQGAAGALTKWRSDNRSAEVIAAGITVDPGLVYTYEFNPSFGGPIRRDRLWFYFTYKLQSAKNLVPGVFFEDGREPPPGGLFTDGRPGYTEGWPNYSYVTRLTWQATRKDKIRAYIDVQQNGGKFADVSRLVTPEASHRLFTPRGWTPQVKWTQTTTNRMLVEAGLTLFDQNFRREPQEGVTVNTLRHVEASTGLNTKSYDNFMDSATKNYTAVASLAYVTGSHAFKTGINHGWGQRVRTWEGLAVSALRFNLGVPQQVTVRNLPVGDSIERMNADFGLYAQDAWTMKRLTLNIGGRFDHFNAEVPAAVAPAGTFVPERVVPAVQNVPNWNDWAVRLGVSYDLFGTGKTAVKANVSKYVASEAVGYASAFNVLAQTTQNRNWTDLNGDRTVVNANGSIQLNEITGGTANFGQISSTLRPDGDIAREYNWEYGVSVQHEVLPRVSVQAGYHRRTFHNLRIIDNLNLDPVRDWNAFTIVAPLDSRLPGGGGYPITVYNRNAVVATTAVDNLLTYSPTNTRTYNGFDINGSARLSNGATVLGGIVTERTVSISCDVTDNPNNLRFCDSVGPFFTQFKLNGSYPLPWDFQVSGAFTSRPGGSINANYQINAAVAGRPIITATGGNNFTISLIEPDTVFRERINTVDLRFARTFRFGRYQLQALVDIFNMANFGTVTTVNQTFGPVWLAPTGIVEGRYIRLGGQLSF